MYKAITVTNTSNAAVEVYVTTTGENASAFMYEPKSFELGVNASKQFKVYFKPNASNLQRYSATLNFSITAGVVCTQIEMIGTGTSGGGGDDKGLISDPGSYKFPATDIGSESCKTFIIKNTSSSAATINSIEISETEAFVIDETIALPLTIQPGETYALEVCFKPTEQSQMYATGKVAIEYALANSSEDRKLYIALSAGANSGGGDKIVFITPSQYKFPATDVGQTTCADFLVKNLTDAAVTITAITLEADDVYTMTSEQTVPFNLGAGESAKITVCFTPTSGSNNGWKGALSVSYTPDGGVTTKHTTATFYSMYEKPACLGADEGDDWTEPILIGGKDDRILLIVNKTNADIIINEIRLAGEDAAAFTINATVPLTVPANGQVQIPFTFAPFGGQNGYIKEKYIAAVVLSLSSDACPEFETHIWGYGLREHDDKDSTKTVAISLFPNEKQTIGLSNRGIKESYTLLFINNLDKDVTVQSISMMDGTKFKIAATNPATTPFTLKPQETFTVTIEFESADGLLYKDKLIIVSDFAATTIEFDLQGINASAATVRSTLPEGVSVALMPNPMRSSTTIDLEGVRSASIEVSDVLGSTIMQTVAAGDWQWNGRMSNGAPAPAGTYFVRVQGESTNGERFVTTNRIVIER